MTFRFDDISVNTDMVLVNQMTDYLLDKYKDIRVIWAVSPMVYDLKDEKVKGRVFPSIFNAYSDYRKFYKVDKIGIPELHPNVVTAGHGLMHVDHRLLSYEAQEMSIISSCYLVGASIFVPPFNKWNNDTEQICVDNSIVLVKWENGWLSCEHNAFNENHNKWYIHSYVWTFDKFKEWLK